MTSRTVNRTLTLLSVAVLFPLRVNAAGPLPADTKSWGSPTEALYSSAARQARIVSERPIGSIALENTRLDAKGTGFGFAAKSPEARFFLAGSFYSEALALARGGKWPEAAKRAEAIERILVDLGAPSGLYTYAVKAKNHLRRKDLPAAAALDYLSLFQPLFSDFAKAQSADKLALFTTGAWISDMGLAAGAGNAALLRDDAMLQRISADMKRMDAPKGVQEALEQINAISTQKEITERDAKTVLGLVQRIQALLG